jgi:hypothetical protein
MKSKVDTWLPVFSGFYGTIWESDDNEEREIEYINEQRGKKGLDPITWDEVDWNYAQHHLEVSKAVTRYIAADLKALLLISEMTFQELRSPREYNFTNDSINVDVVLTAGNVKKIWAYLIEHKEAFKVYLKDRYTTRSGFFSSYSNDFDAWASPVNMGATLANGHMLGSVLNFILLNENGEDYEQEIYERVFSNGCVLEAKNYRELIGE